MRYQGPSGTVPGEYIDAFATGLANFPDHPAFWQGQLYISASDGIYQAPIGGGAVSKWTSGEPGGALAQAGQFAFGLDGYVYLASGTSGNVLRYDNQTGVYVDTFASGLDYTSGLAMQSHIIPEPATALLIGVGVLVLSAARRRNTTA